MQFGCKVQGIFPTAPGLKKGWLVIRSNPPGNGSFLPSPSVGVNMQGALGIHRF